MSTTGLPEPKVAYQNLFDGIHARVFFQKMASHGYVPQSRQQAQYMLDVAGKLRAVEQSPATKIAAEQNDPFAAMSRHLDEVLGLQPHVKAAAAQEEEIAIRQAARGIMQDPMFYNSVLSLKAAEAAQLQQEFQGR